jgi:hypothetical protein
MGAEMGDRRTSRPICASRGTEFFIGPVLRSRTRGTWMMSVARPIRDATAGGTVMVAARWTRLISSSCGAASTSGRAAPCTCTTAAAS